MTLMMNDTIVALVTAVGESSVGILRISGSDAVAVVNKIYKGKADLEKVASHTIQYGYVYDYKQNKHIDEALFMIMRGPRSFTAEDIVEIQCHGGMVVIKSILALLLANGARLAEHGEFSKRAFLNGRMDLAQAESVMDIIQAKTQKGVDLAINQLNGGLSNLVQELRADLLELIAFIQADIDYPDDDIERLTRDEQSGRVQTMIAEIKHLLDYAQKGKIIKDGLQAVIVGKPNVGKSSLMNALLKQNRAIVTNIPGTTRDSIEESIHLKGIPLKLVDTAGIRDTDDIVEKIGVDKAHECMNQADLILYVFDGSKGIDAEDKELLNQIVDKPILFLCNKTDLGVKDEVKAEILSTREGAQYIELSVLKQVGLEELEEAIIEMFFDGKVEVSQDILVTNARHIQILEDSRAHLENFYQANEMGLSVDFLVIDLQNAWEKLGKIIGETVEEDLLNQIFSKFCLGK